jgi:hypothetical protein
MILPNGILYMAISFQVVFYGGAIWLVGCGEWTAVACMPVIAVPAQPL